MFMLYDKDNGMCAPHMIASFSPPRGCWQGGPEEPVCPVPGVLLQPSHEGRQGMPCRSGLVYIFLSLL